MVKNTRPSGLELLKGHEIQSRGNGFDWEPEIVNRNTAPILQLLNSFRGLSDVSSMVSSRGRPGAGRSSARRSRARWLWRTTRPSWPERAASKVPKSFFGVIDEALGFSPLQHLQPGEPGVFNYGHKRSLPSEHPSVDVRYRLEAYATLTGARSKGLAV